MKIVKLLFIFAFAAVAVHGQEYIYVDDGSITPIYEDVSIYPTNVVVGYTQSGNTLYVDDGITLNAGSMYVGVSNSTDNVLQFEPSSKGYFSGQLIIGTDSSDNIMNVFEEADVVSTYGTIGDAATADDNVVDISGSGSSWNVVSNLAVGLEGSGNSLLVSDEAVVAANAIFIGVGQAATNNQIVVDAASLIATENLVVGDAGIASLLVVTNGGSATAADVVIGYYEESTGNVVRVGGTDSILTVSDTLTVGTVSNEANRVVVSDGGAVQVGELLIGGDENYFDLNEGGQLTVSNDFNASLDGFNYNEGSALYIGGELSGQTNGLEGGRTLGITGADAIWDQTGSNITVGGSSSDNSLVVIDDSMVIVDNLMVGTGSNVVGNTVSVSYYDAEIAVADTVEIGSATSSDNVVDLWYGGQLTVGSGIVVNGSNNMLRVRGGGRLRVENDFNASMAGFSFENGGILETTGTLTGMTNVLENGRAIWLDGGTWAPSGVLTVGGISTNSSLSVKSGGTLSSSGAVLGNSVSSMNNEVYVQDAGSTWNVGGALTVGGAGSGNFVEVTDGALVSDNTEIGSSGDNNYVRISGSNATWTAGTVRVGVAGSNNALYIEDGAQLDSTSGFIGGTGSGNAAMVSGMDSVWTAASLEVDGQGHGSALTVSNDGKVDVVGSLALKNGATLSFSTNGSATVGSYSQDASSIFTFHTVTNEAVDSGTAVLDATGGAADLAGGSTIAFTGEVGDVNAGVTNSRRLIASSSLLVSGGSGTVDDLNGEVSNGLFFYNFMADGNDLLMQIYRQNLGDSAGFDTNSQMYAVSTEIDELASSGNEAANNQLAILGDLSGAEQNAQLSQLYDRGAPTYMHMEGMLAGMRQVKKNGVMPDSMWPVGANGPHLYGEQAKAWVKGYGSWASQDGSGSNSGYDQNVYGVIVGFDKAFGDLLAGLAGGYASSDISQDDGDDSESTTGYGVLYGSWGSSDWFADGSLAFGMGSVKNDTGTIFDNSGDTDANQLAFSLGGGKEMIYMEDRLFVTPSAAFLAGWYMQDGYTEKAVNAVARKVDDYDRWSMQSDFGVEAAFHKPLNKVTLMPSAHVNWLHEFNADVDRVGYSLVDGTGNYSFGMQAPVADLFELGVGLSLWAEDKNGTVYEWALGYDARFGDGYSASAFSTRLVAEF